MNQFNNAAELVDAISDEMLVQGCKKIKSYSDTVSFNVQGKDIVLSVENIVDAQQEENLYPMAKITIAGFVNNVNTIWLKSAPRYISEDMLVLDCEDAIKDYVLKTIANLQEYLSVQAARKEELEEMLQNDEETNEKKVRGCFCTIDEDINFVPFLHVHCCRYGTYATEKQVNYMIYLSQFQSASNRRKISKWSMSYAIGVITRLGLKYDEVYTTC